MRDTTNHPLPQKTVIRKQDIDLASFVIVILPLGVASPSIAQKSATEGTPSQTTTIHTTA